MKPIGQTFFVNKARAGTAGVYLTQIDIYFKSISSSKSITLELRETDNGYPTSTVVPNSTVMAYPYTIPDPSSFGGVYRDRGAAVIARASDDASLATSFIFSEPPYLEANKSYAFVLIPGGGTDEYEVWTSEIGQKDVISTNVVDKNNETGTLFISSNDIQWTPVQNEDIKFKIYQANFTSTTGSAVFTVANTDMFTVKNFSKNFQINEPTCVTTAIFNISRLTASSITGTFNIGETIFQSNGSANVAIGILAQTNSTSIVVSNTVGTFSNTYQVKGATSSANAVISLVTDDTTFTSGSNTITVPYSGVFAANDYIWLESSDRGSAFYSKVTAIPSNTTLQLANNVTFTESSGAFVAKFNINLYGEYREGPIDSSSKYVFLSSLANLSASNNTTNSVGQYIVGLMSKASAIIDSVENIEYNSVTPQLLQATPKDTFVNFSMKGTLDNGTYVNDDSSYFVINNDSPNELRDAQRVILSASREVVSRSGVANSSMRIKANLSTLNIENSPVIDTLQRTLVVTKNIIVPENRISGYNISLTKTVDNMNLVPAVGTTVTFGSNTATVDYANSTFIRVYNPNGSFTTGTVTCNTGSLSFTANASLVDYYDESENSGHPSVPRYISKNVILAPDQDADDAITYLTAYRPVNTNIFVYIKAQSVNDTTPFNNRVWSKMVEGGSIGLLSSKANVKDYVELDYKLPESIPLFTSGANCTNNSTTVNMYDTGSINVGDMIYIKDNANSTFIVKEVISKPAGNTSVVVSSNVGFNSTNAAIGVIPNLQTEHDVFRYDGNEYIARYVNPDGDVHDTIKTFAIKIVMVSNNSVIFPKVADMRTLALQN